MLFTNRRAAANENMPHLTKDNSVVLEGSFGGCAWRWPIELSPDYVYTANRGPMSRAELRLGGLLRFQGLLDEASPGACRLMPGISVVWLPDDPKNSVKYSDLVAIAAKASTIKPALDATIQRDPN